VQPQKRQTTLLFLFEKEVRDSLRNDRQNTTIFEVKNRTHHEKFVSKTSYVKMFGKNVSERTAGCSGYEEEVTTTCYVHKISCY